MVYGWGLRVRDLDSRFRVYGLGIWDYGLGRVRDLDFRFRV